MSDPFGELFEKFVHSKYPSLKYIAKSSGALDFDAGDFKIEVKCSNSNSGVHIPYQQFRNKRKQSPVYVVGFHDFFCVPNHVEQFHVSSWYVLSSALLTSFFNQTKYLRIKSELLERLVFTPDDNFDVRLSTPEEPGFILHRNLDTKALDYFIRCGK